MKSHISQAKLSIAVSLLAVSAISTPVFAETQKAHEHGAARLTIATSDNGLEIALETPAANILGFEYKPTSDSDIATLEKAEETLKKGELIFAANSAAGCKLTDVDLESTLFEGHDDHEDHDDEKGHDEHDHDDHKGESAHSDIDATWNFTCEKPSAISSVEVKLFTAFPKGFEEIDVDWISAEKAGHVELEADGSVILK